MILLPMVDRGIVTSEASSMTLSTYQTIHLHEYSDGTLGEVTVPLSAEYPVTVRINGGPYITVACLGTDLESQITGYLISEGIINNTGQIQRIHIDEDALTANAVLAPDDSIALRLERIKILSAAGGVNIRSLPARKLVRKNLPTVFAKVINTCMTDFLSSSREHEITHGVHGAALYSITGEKIVFFDDIGRHNAIDKVIGHAARNKLTLEDKMIFSTGRISSEIATKSINAFAPMLVTRASSTTLSVELLRDYNILTIIRAQGDRFFIVNGKEQIIL